MKKIHTLTEERRKFMWSSHLGSGEASITIQYSVVIKLFVNKELFVEGSFLRLTKESCEEHIANIILKVKY